MLGTSEYDSPKKSGNGKGKGKGKKDAKLQTFSPYPPRTLLDYRVNKSESITIDETTDWNKPRSIKSYWIGPYEVWDWEAEHCVTKGKGGGGKIPLSPKPRTMRKMGSHVILTGLHQKGRPFAIALERIRPHKSTALSFEQVFGSGGKGAVSLEGYVFEEAEDLTLGIDATRNDDEDL
jgi:hypothetical protein